MNDVILRKINKNDANLILKLYSDKESCIMCGVKPIYKIEEANLIIQTLQKSGGSFVVTLNNSKENIGLITLSRDFHRYNKKSYMLSYIIDKEHRGKNIIPYAVRCINKYAFEMLGANIVSASHFKDNIKSKRVLEKCGFTYEGTLRNEYVKWNGEILDSCMYSITLNEYINNKEEEKYYGENNIAEFFRNNEENAAK